MTNNINNRYGINRNLWRKTYGYNKFKPINVTITDQITSQSFTYDLNQTTRHRDFYIIRDIAGQIITARGIEFGEYDEDLVFFDFSDGTEKLFNFNFEFTNNPIVTLKAENENELSNINVFGISYSTTGAYIGISAPYSGNIRYRAIYSDTYPAYVTSAYTTSIMTASAGSTTVSLQDYYYSNFGTLQSAPEFIYETAWDSTDDSSNIDIRTNFVTSNLISSSLSSIYSKDIHFIVIDSGSLGGFMYTFGIDFGE